MKRLGFALFAAALLHAGPAAALPLPRVGLELSPQLSGFSKPGSAAFDAQDHYRWTAQGGVTLEWPLRGPLVLVSGIGYGEHADRQDLTVSVSANGAPPVSASAPLDVRLRQLSVPVRVEWRSAGWRFGVGPETRYTVAADERWGDVTLLPAGAPAGGAMRGPQARPQAQIFESVSSQHGWQDATDAYRRWSLGAQLTAGREFSLRGHAVRVDARWHEGVTHQQWSADAAQRARAAQLAFGWRW